MVTCVVLESNWYVCDSEKAGYYSMFDKRVSSPPSGCWWRWCYYLQVRRVCPVSCDLHRPSLPLTPAWGGFDHRHTEESACALLPGEHWEVECRKWASTPRRCAPHGQSIFKHRGWESSQWWLYPAPMWGLSSTLLPHFIFLTFSAWPWASGTTLPFYSMCWVGRLASSPDLLLRWRIWSSPFFPGNPEGCAGLSALLLEVTFHTPNGFLCHWKLSVDCLKSARNALWNIDDTSPWYESLENSFFRQYIKNLLFSFCVITVLPNTCKAEWKRS